MTTLREKSFKFGWDGKVFNWFHPADVKNNDKFIDCTNMDDAHFERLVFIKIGSRNDKNKGKC